MSTVYENYIWLLSRPNRQWSNILKATQFRVATSYKTCESSLTYKVFHRYYLSLQTPHITKSSPILNIIHHIMNGIKSIHRVGWHSGNAYGMHSGDIPFKHQLLSFVIFLSLPRQTTGQYVLLNGSLQLLPTPLPIHHI
jgi:hypothetical protein